MILKCLVPSFSRQTRACSYTLQSENHDENQGFFLLTKLLKDRKSPFWKSFSGLLAVSMEGAEPAEQ